MLAHNELHSMFSRANPKQWAKYMLAGQLFSIINNEKPANSWIKLQCNFSINERTGNFIFARTNKNKIGLNCLHNRLNIIENELVFTDFSLSKSNFKIKCKR